MVVVVVVVNLVVMVGVLMMVVLGVVEKFERLLWVWFPCCGKVHLAKQSFGKITLFQQNY